MNLNQIQLLRETIALQERACRILDDLNNESAPGSTERGDFLSLAESARNNLLVQQAMLIRQTIVAYVLLIVQHKSATPSDSDAFPFSREFPLRIGELREGGLIFRFQHNPVSGCINLVNELTRDSTSIAIDGAEWEDEKLGIRFMAFSTFARIQTWHIEHFQRPLTRFKPDMGDRDLANFEYRW